ncbi:MAG: HEPN domain-containing protein [Armatimonadota bacterium]|nr:HEPN domain-containing protein [Armatimonadota bacterium]MDR7444687.1 HEPN domain-containing protein [Armatimonadota bacterium]MDR7569191.1 HEPN domain-containing protein [Armatimonadota bacterium]MDR7613309.1 HEPN domain-containing protein [Armatimonadota bacterium]
MKKELRDFVAKAERFLQSAEHLFKVGDYDSCASRCYYAMFFMAEAALMLKGLSASSHRGVIGLFGKHFVQTGIFDPELGRALRRAYDVRLTGDYAVGITVSREEAEDLLRAAHEFVVKVRAYLEREAQNHD